MGLWYSKDTSMSLTTYADADHAGCQDTRRSTSRSAQFLGYPKSVKEARDNPIETLIGKFNERTLRTYVKYMEVRKHCCFNEMKDRCKCIIQTMVDIISDSACQSLCANKKFNLHLSLIAISDDTEVVLEEKPTELVEDQVLRYHAQLNRPYYVAEVRKNMVMYLKNQGGYKMNYFKGMKYEDIRPIFEKVWDQIQSFTPMDSEKEKGSEKKGNRKKTLARKRASGKDSEEIMKKQKLEDDTEKEDLKACLDIIQGDYVAIDIESLATKYPIVDWKTHVLTENFMYYQIFRADGSSKNFKIFSEMLDDFDR
ncbi:hypothetical protein Tco_0411632 [Tanacetum coccineum]